MSVGSQENAPAAVSTGTAHGVPQVVRRARRGGASRRSRWITRAIFVLLLIGLSILFLYPFVWLVSASFKPRGETFDNAPDPARTGPGTSPADNAEPVSAVPLQRRAGRRAGS